MNKCWLIFFVTVGCWSLNLYASDQKKGRSGLTAQEKLDDQIRYGQAECDGHHKDPWRDVRQDKRDARLVGVQNRCTSSKDSFDEKRIRKSS